MPSAASSALATPASTLMPLHGAWQREVGGRALDVVPVPGAFAPMGECTLIREFELPADWSGEDRHFLRTEGVLAWVTFALNGRELATVGPWSRHRIEIPAGLLARRNRITAVVRDIGMAFGPTPGRRFDAGLVRPIGIERRARTHIADVGFSYVLSGGFASAACRGVVELDGPATAPATCTLAEAVSGRVVATATAARGEAVHFTVEHPRLWSPATPMLYTLTVACAGETTTEQVGFRQLAARGRDLWLNGERLLVKGVCRHEFMTGFGYAPPDDEVRRELSAIRHAGFNYIRLVHSPQAPCVARIASEIGILVSEEPGTCFHDLADPKVADPAIEALRAMVRRDRNQPAVLAWFIYNECNPDNPYAVRAAGVCRELDPGCLVAMADCSGRNDDIKAMAKAADLSFYGINIYDWWVPNYVARMEILGDRPMLITEWGGCILQGNPRMLDTVCQMFVKHTREGEAKRVIGGSFWAWADYEEYSRDPFAAIDGWTVEGLVDQQRRAKPDLARMSQWCFDMDHPPQAAAPVAQVLQSAAPRAGSWTTIDLEHVAGDQSTLEATVAAKRAKYAGRYPALERVQVDGVAFSCRGGAGPARPLLIGAGREQAVIPIGRAVRGLCVLGHVAPLGGYPANSIFSVHHQDAEAAKAYGEAAAAYELVFDDGVETVELRHGEHVLRSNDICRWWTTAPRAPFTVPALRATIHPSYEVLRVDLWETAFTRPRVLRQIRWTLRDAASIQALYAITTLDA